MRFIKRAVVEDVEFIEDLNSLDVKKEEVINPIKKNLDYIDSILNKDKESQK